MLKTGSHNHIWNSWTSSLLI